MPVFYLSDLYRNLHFKKNEERTIDRQIKTYN